MTEIPPEPEPPHPKTASGPLAPFHGEKPPAPDWFVAALADAPERRLIESQGSRIELLTWGEVGKPGVLLLHGAGGHADWWTHIAPFLASDYRVASMSMAGAGRSDWREVYSHDRTLDDIDACAQAAGLFASGDAPTYVGHSFGGHVVLHALLHRPDTVSRAILVDSAMGPPPQDFLDDQARWEQTPALRRLTRPLHVYPSFAAAMARFRLVPHQPPGEIYITDHLARHALTQDRTPDGSPGWRWAQDPTFWEKFEGPVQIQQTVEGRTPRRPVAYIYGELSVMVAAGALTSPDIPAGPKIGIPQSHHHVMMDQPLALVAALRTLLLSWSA